MKVDTALDGEHGLALAQEHPPDLLLLDIMLPGLDGISICSHFAAQPENGAYPHPHAHRAWHRSR